MFHTAPLMNAHHRTPLKRVSQGSLFALSRSQSTQKNQSAPHGLEFIEPAMSEFVDETESLLANVESLRVLEQSLAKFNESFASWLYAMDMNALTSDWPEAPTEESFIASERRAETNALRALEEAKAAAEAQRLAKQERAAAALAAEQSLADITRISSGTQSNTKSGPGVVKKKKLGPKPKLSAKEKKERSMELEKIISTLPLEFRGGDPNLRSNMEAVVEGLLDAPDRALKLADLVKPPDLSQTRVTKCLIALVNRKMAYKDSSTGQVLYHWQGI
ncbi:hypothetical protein BDV98DRAFT_543983 [Pterulicium gracile]|uniref:DASH complex subunit DAM1 n=1 Tax=Pterulicium gracile TaxID=1884261 RepID=A0A5C3QSD4_9AGAR|nr:hypothetical protein BDV98DRAFT_543983 [Pterula gracilis]